MSHGSGTSDGVYEVLFHPPFTPFAVGYGIVFEICISRLSQPDIFEGGPFEFGPDAVWLLTILIVFWEPPVGGIHFYVAQNAAPFLWIPPLYSVIVFFLFYAGWLKPALLFLFWLPLEYLIQRVIWIPLE